MSGLRESLCPKCDGLSVHQGKCALCGWTLAAPKFVEVPAWKIEAWRHLLMGTDGKTAEDESNISALYREFNGMRISNPEKVASDWEREREAQMLARLKEDFPE